MNKYLKYALLGALALGIQGCTLTHDTEVLNLQEIEDHRGLFIANQSFKCQNAFAGSAHKYIVNKDDILKAYTIEKKVRVVSTFGATVADKVNEDALLLMHDGRSARTGFLIYPNGTFVYDIETQYGAAYPSEIHLISDCKWEGKTPFEPLSLEKFKEMRAKVNENKK